MAEPSKIGCRVVRLNFLKSEKIKLERFKPIFVRRKTMYLRICESSTQPKIGFENPKAANRTKNVPANCKSEFAPFEEGPHLTNLLGHHKFADLRFVELICGLGPFASLQGSINM
jgi:hypothetical protein